MKRVGFVGRLLIGLVCWPFEALFTMWGLDILEHYGFGVPTPGYFWASWAISLALGFLYSAATFTHHAVDEVEKG